MKREIKLFVILLILLGLQQLGCKKDDTGDGTVPFIEVMGSNPLYWAVGHAYIDPGAIAYDITREGDTVDLTSNIKTDINVDVSKEGDYTVTYNVTDDSGLAAEEKVRDVKVVVGK